MKNFEKLEVGAIYRDCDGDVVKILEHSPGDNKDGGQWYGRFLNESSRVNPDDPAYYHEDGRINYNFGQHCDAGGDLVEKLA